MISWFYGSLKEYQVAPRATPRSSAPTTTASSKGSSRGYAMLDGLLRRLFRHKDALRRVLDRLEIALNTNAAENDIRAFGPKRQITGGDLMTSRSHPRPHIGQANAA
jgi:Transposase IS66 family